MLKSEIRTRSCRCSSPWKEFWRFAAERLPLQPAADSFSSGSRSTTITSRCHLQPQILTRHLQRSRWIAKAEVATTARTLPQAADIRAAATSWGDTRTALDDCRLEFGTDSTNIHQDKDFTRYTDEQQGVELSDDLGRFHHQPAKERVAKALNRVVSDC
jgi:hypothetical protein